MTANRPLKPQTPVAYQPGTHGGSDVTDRFQAASYSYNEGGNPDRPRTGWRVLDTVTRSTVFAHRSETAARRHAHKRNVANDEEAAAQ